MFDLKNLQSETKSINSINRFPFIIQKKNTHTIFIDYLIPVFDDGIVSRNVFTIVYL